MNTFFGNCSSVGIRLEIPLFERSERRSASFGIS